MNGFIISHNDPRVAEAVVIDKAANMCANSLAIFVGDMLDSSKLVNVRLSGPSALHAFPYDVRRGMAVAIVGALVALCFVRSSDSFASAERACQESEDKLLK